MSNEQVEETQGGSQRTCCDRAYKDGYDTGRMHALAPQPPAEAQARPAKPAECADGCPALTVCDHCQWPPGPDTEAQAQGGGGAGESDGALLVRLGDDAQKWAREFRATAIKLGYSDMDEGWLISWFANAIEHSSDVRRWRTGTAPPSAPTLPRYGFPTGTEPRPVPCADGYWTPWHLAQPQQPAADLWCMHIIGPDDVYPAPSKAHAEKAAAWFNERFAETSERTGVLCRAEAAAWPHSAESHAESVDDFITKWLVPQQPVAEAQAQGGGEAVAYLDIGTGGYMDLGTELPDETLFKLPPGRHMLGIIGTYGVDGYTAPPSAPVGVEDAEAVLDAFRRAGMHIESGATFSVRGQIAQLLNGAAALAQQPAAVDTKPDWWVWTINDTHTGCDNVEPPEDAYDEGSLIPLWKRPPSSVPTDASKQAATPSSPVGVETVDAAAWIEVLELPEGFRVAEHLPGIWEYQFDIEDEADEDSDRKVSGASWNHPALAAIAAWGHAYDTLAQQPAASAEEQPAPDVSALVEALEGALEYWRHRQQRYKNRRPKWVIAAESAIAAHRKQGGGE